MNCVSEIIQSTKDYIFKRYYVSYNSQHIEFVTKSTVLSEYILEGEDKISDIISHYAASQFNVEVPKPQTLIVLKGNPLNDGNYILRNDLYDDIMKEINANTSQTVTDIYQFIHRSPADVFEARIMLNKTRDEEMIYNASSFINMVKNFTKWFELVSEKYWRNENPFTSINVLQWKFAHMPLKPTDFNELIIDMKYLPEIISEDEYDFLRMCEDHIFRRIRMNKTLTVQKVMPVYRCAKEHLSIFKL